MPQCTVVGKERDGIQHKLQGQPNILEKVVLKIFTYLGH